jgi:Tfp pilus assembly protein PilN
VPKRRVIVEISPTRLEIAVVKGRQMAQRSASRQGVNLAEHWAASLEAIGPALAKLVDAVDARGAEATVLYTSATSAIGVYSCPKAAGAARASSAASLALAEAAAFPLGSNCSDLCTLVSDQRSEGESQAHTLAVADTDATLVSLEKCVAGAGLTVESLVPSDAALFAEAVSHAMDMGKEAGTHLVLSIGEHSSILAVAGNGRLRFARQIALGSESLVEALTREIRPAGGEPVTLTVAQAREALAASGIVTREQPFMESPALSGDAVLPLLQPVLQRWVVEIRQSLRFGLQEQERTGAHLHALGAGASVPRLFRVIADQLSLPFKDDAPGMSGAGVIDAWIGAAPRLSLVPTRVTAQRAGRRLRRAMLIGAASAAAAVGIDAALTRIDLSHRADELRQTKARLATAAGASTLRDRAIAEQTALTLAKQRAAARTGEAPPWDVVLAVLSKQTPPTMKLTDVQLSFDKGQPTVRVIGRAPLGDRADSKGVLKGYMDALSSVPLVKGCKLGATQRDEGFQTFEMTLTLVSMPSPAPGRPAAFSNAAPREETP